MPRSQDASCSSHGLTASSRLAVALYGDASPLVRVSSVRRAPAWPKAYRSPPSTADSTPGRAVTARTVRALGRPQADAAALLGLIWLFALPSLAGVRVG